MKKLTAILLTICMFASMLTGCSGKVTAESLLTNADKKVTEAKSVEATMDMELEMGIEYSGFSMGMGLNGGFEIQSHNESESAHIEGEMEVSVLGMNEKVTVEGYVVKDGDKYISYSNSDDEGWTYEENEEVEGLTSTLNIYSYALKNLEGFKLAEETTTFNDVECYLVEGKLSGDALKEVFSTMDADELFEGAGDVDLGDLEMDLACYFNKETKEPMGIELGIVDEVEIPVEEEGVSGAMTIETLEMDITYESFNKLDEIEVPKDVKKSAIPADEFESIDDELTLDPSDDELFPEDPVDDDFVDGEYISYIEGMEKVIINGNTYQMPFSVQTLLDTGLILEEDYVGYIVNKDQTEIVSLTLADDSDVYISLYVYNPTEETLAIEKCEIYGMSVYSDSMGSVKFASALGFDFNSSYEDVVAILGEPTSIYSGEYLKSCSWETEDYQYTIDIDFDTETNSMYSISMQNYYMY